MITTKDLFKSKPLPKWISSHPVFKEVESIGKIFPRIGLNNAEGDCTLDNYNGVKKVAKHVLTTFNNALLVKSKEVRVHQNDLSNVNQKKLDRLLELITLIRAQTKIKDDCIVVNNGKITLNLPADIMLSNETNFTLRKGEALFRIYNKINEQLKELNIGSMQRLEDTIPFKDFSRENIPSNNKFKIVFSSDGADGIWDIATMSMRGVSSCQSWSGEYKHCLIGSLIDPFVGIIYLTSGAKFNKYGSKMIKRCVVRFAVNEKTRKPVIVLDNMYPSYDSKVIDQFKLFIKSKTNDKFEIFYAAKEEESIRHSYMPLTDVRKILQGYGRDGINSSDPADDDACCTNETLQSYQDFHLKNVKSVGRDEQAILFEKNSKNKARKFVATFSKSFHEAVKNTEINKFSAAIKPVVSKLKADNDWHRSAVINDVASIIANGIVKSVDKKSFNNSDTYLQRVYYSYFLNKGKIVEELKAKLCKNLNGALALKTKEKVKQKQMTAMLDTLLPEIDVLMRQNLMKVVAKRKEKNSGPLPLPG